MDCRHSTPPSAIIIHDHDDIHCPGDSASTTATSAYFPNDWSPITAVTAPATPPKSPPKYQLDAPGQWLLPKPRMQDQLNGLSDRSYACPSSGHMRTFSCPEDFFHVPFEGQYGGPLMPSRPTIQHRSVSPPQQQARHFAPTVDLSLAEPVQIVEGIHSLGPSPGGVRAASVPQVRTHSRTNSNGSIDTMQLLRHGYPYRSSPTPQPSGPRVHRISRTPSAMSHLAPIVPGVQIQSYPNNRRTTSPPSKRARLCLESAFSPEVETPLSSVLEYLTAPNPTPSLVKRLTETGTGPNTHYWYDIRNVKPWADFNVATISAIPSLLSLLNCPIPTSELPCPVRLNQVPETLRQLADICAQHHAVKVNAALKIALGGKKHMTIRTLAHAPGARQQPEFVADYQSESEKIIFGNGTGRVVGIVKSFDQWNSGMQRGSPNDKVNYLRHLAHLHRFMREHGTRYGFIMTEIELVCVRAGGAPTEDGVPLFGYLEIAAAVQISASGTEEGGRLRMTVGLALWYLHMLAKEQPFPGQYHWKMAVGTPAALSRQRHLERDRDLPKPSTPEKREAKRVRGWVWPDEPLSKRETGRKPRARAR